MCLILRIAPIRVALLNERPDLGISTPNQLEHGSDELIKSSNANNNPVSMRHPSPSHIGPRNPGSNHGY